MAKKIGKSVLGKTSKTSRKIPSFSQQEKLVKKLFPGAEICKYNRDYGQIEIAGVGEEYFISTLEKIGFKVQETQHWKADGVNAIATKPGWTPIVLLEY